MRVLQICHKPPFPPIDGGAIAMNNITQGILNLGHAIKVVSIETPKHPAEINNLPKNYLEKTGFESVFIDTSIKLKAAFFNLFSKRSYNIERFICEELRAKIIDCLKDSHYDVVILEGLFVAPYFKAVRKNFKGKIILRAHNIEFRIWERMAINAKNPFKKMYLNFLSRRLKAFEIKSLTRMDGVCTMTDIDSQEIKKLCPKVPVCTIPSGYILPNELQEAREEIEQLSLFHIASMNWQPNQQAVDWFMNEAWDKIKLQHPQCTLYLAGRKMPEKYFNLKDPQVQVIGEVATAADFYKGKNIMIVPLLAGSGMRIKIIEGMAMGKVIVSTSIGAEGIQYTHQKNIIIADTAEDFAKNISILLLNPELCKEIGLNARELVKKEYNNDVFCKKMIDFIESI